MGIVFLTDSPRISYIYVENLQGNVFGPALRCIRLLWRSTTIYSCLSYVTLRLSRFQLHARHETFRFTWKLKKLTRFSISPSLFPPDINTLYRNCYPTYHTPNCEPRSSNSQFDHHTASMRRNATCNFFCSCCPIAPIFRLSSRISNLCALHTTRQIACFVLLICISTVQLHSCLANRLANCALTFVLPSCPLRPFSDFQFCFRNAKYRIFYVLLTFMSVSPRSTPENRHGFLFFLVVLPFYSAPVAFYSLQLLLIIR